jgi:hypothetical protein
MSLPPVIVFAMLLPVPVKPPAPAKVRPSMLADNV